MSASGGPVPLTHLDMTVADGLSEAQARAIWRAVAQARAGRFDVLAVHAELVEAGYTPLAADALVQEMIERLADRQT
jgi:arginase family enzyme